MNDDRRLIEDYLPIVDISAEASREKSVRKGHISTLHLWWARRPLVACRAAVYAALVPASQFVPGNGTDAQKKSLGRANAAKFIKRLCRYPSGAEPEIAADIQRAVAEAQGHILKAHADRLTRELQDTVPNGLPLPEGLSLRTVFPVEVVIYPCTSTGYVFYRRMLNVNASSFCAPPPPVADWAIAEFGHAELGDDRRTDRLLMIATAFAQQPTAPIPQACEPGPAIQGAYRFFENEAIEPEAIRDAHHQATLERLRPHPVVLALQDTSTLNYATHPQTHGLGPIGTRRQKIIGLLLHSTLAVTPRGQPLGLLHTAVRARDPKAAGSARQRHAKPIAEKESHKWLDSLSACQEVASHCPATLLVNIADREGDLYDLFAQALAPTDEPRVHLVVRSRHNRRLLGQDRRLWEAVGRRRAAGQLQVRVGRRGEQPARLATLSIRFGPVTVAAPTRSTAQPPLTLWSIEARELHPPKGCIPILWRLLTTLPVTSLAEAGEKVGWYAQRWQIEVIHKVLKSGCQIEQRQLETATRLERVLAVDQVVAWRLLALCKGAREQPSAAVSAWLSQAEWQALWCHVHQRTTPPTTPPGVRQAVRWIAQLGGFLARTGDGEPGPVTLWRGLHRLNDLTAMWRLCHGKHCKRQCAQ